MIVAAAAVYVSDFGERRIIASRFSGDRSALVLDMEYRGVGYLRPFPQNELANTGDSAGSWPGARWWPSSRPRPASLPA